MPPTTHVALLATLGIRGSACCAYPTAMT